MYEFIHRIPHQPWSKPSKAEEEYVHRKELQERAARARRDADLKAQEERERLRQLHRDHCPRCGVTLEKAVVRSAEVDRCPECSGVWLDLADLEGLLPEEHQEPLREMFRALFVDYSLGSLPRSARGRDEE